MMDGLGDGLPRQQVIAAFDPVGLVQFAGELKLERLIGPR